MLKWKNYSSGFLPLDHCVLLTLYSCKDIVMEHKHNNITGKTFSELVFTVVYTGCKPHSLLLRPMPMLSLLSLHLIPVLSPLTPCGVFSAFLGHSGSSILKLPCGTAPGILGSRFCRHLAVSCSAALCLRESLLSIGFHFPMRLFSCPRASQISQALL